MEEFTEDVYNRPSPLLEDWVPDESNWSWCPNSDREVLLTNITMQNSFVFEIKTNEITRLK